MPRDYSLVATVKCYFNSCSHKKTTHLTIFSSSSSEFSASASASSTTSNINISVAVSRKNLTERSLRNGKNRQGSNVVSENRKKNLLFGSKKFKSIILLNVITFIYASNIAVIKEVEAFTDPAYFSAVRFAVSTVPFLPFIFQARNDIQTRNSGLELGLWVSLGYISEALGLLTSDAGRASFISLFTVIVIPVLESMLGELVPARTWFGILMSVLGISMLECSGSPPNIGDLFNFISAIFFGIHTLRTEHISRTTRKENFIDNMVRTGANLDGICWTWDWIVEFPWIPALYTGVFSTGLCLWGEIAAMRDVSATETAVIYGLEPVWGAGFAWFLLGERWGVAGWIGAALILGGSLTVQMFGASADESRDDSESKTEKDASMVSDNKKLHQKTLSASPVMVRSNVMDILNK
ncbi:hypothetical protein DH2020_038517 [Rehmannia glutinosa]|uniref:EamA domain-containing protein n=1 Tax=Rehmannia glutinosa TaxID=99300 RepID=A0ABR0UZK4_REHGL